MLGIHGSRGVEGQMRYMLAAFLVVIAGCPSEEEGNSSDTEADTGTSSTGMSGSSASTSSSTTTEPTTTTTEPVTSSESGEPGSSTMVPETSTSSGSSEVECEWFDEPSGERSWGLCTPASMWQQAEDHCVSEGGHLVSIRSAMDGIFAANVLTGIDEAWIGLNDLGGERMYEWTDGTPYEHMNWDDTQPDNPEHRCVAIGVSRRWFDYACDEHRVFVCARPL